MAPGILVDEPQHHLSQPAKRNDDAPRHIFPDGVRTGPTVWHASDFISHPDRWIHPLTLSEISDLSLAADAFIASGQPLTGISQSIFPLPTLSGTLATLRDSLLNGKGFTLLKNFPTHLWSPHKTAVAYLGLGTHLGYPISQNGRGHVLGHVKDVGDDPTQIHAVRIYRTAARQFFHADDGDLVGLLCVHRAQEGGESDIVSVHRVWNVLQAEYPDVAELLTRRVWFFDRKGEVSEGQEEWIRQPVVYLENGGRGRVYCKWDPYYVRSLKRFEGKGVVPPLSAEQKRAMEVLEEVCQREALHMVLEVGDVQFVSNAHLLHARTAYKGE
jgi:hypothetical protein